MRHRGCLTATSRLHQFSILTVALVSPCSDVRGGTPTRVADYRSEQRVRRSGVSDVAKEMLDSLIDLAALQVKLGTILADAVVGLPPQEDDRNDPPETSGEISQMEISAAARAIEAEMLAGYDGGFQSQLRTNFPQRRLEELARAALEAAYSCRNRG